MAGGGAAGKEKDVVLITGCSDGGIGAALAVEFAKVGFSVVATSRNLSSMKELSLNENIHPSALDVTDYEGAKAAVESIIAEHGHIDILINNAGIPSFGPVAEMPISFLEKTFQTNVFGPVVLINAVVPHMAARGKGRIVNVGSVMSLCYNPWGAGYTSSKAALEALTDGLRLELKPFGIDVVLVMPGAVATNIAATQLSLVQANVLQNLKLYKPIEQILLKHAVSEAVTKTPAAEFAKKVVAQVTAKSLPAHFISGDMAIVFQILFYAPFWLRDFIWTKYFGIDEKMLKSVSDKKTD